MQDKHLHLAVFEGMTAEEIEQACLALPTTSKTSLWDEMCDNALLEGTMDDLFEPEVIHLRNAYAAAVGCNLRAALYVVAVGRAHAEGVVLTKAVEQTMGEAPRLRARARL